jgi:UDP-N-acetyl-D-mannosaminuronate dehydrogenase
VKEHRNSPTLDIINNLKKLKVDVCLHDPFFDSKEVQNIVGVNFIENLEDALLYADCIVLLTDHRNYQDSLISKMEKYARKPYIFIDTRKVYSVEDTDERKVVYLGI